MMNSAPADHLRDPQRMEQLYAIAGRIFGRHGIDFSTATRGGGWSNATWLAGGWVLRLAIEPGTDHLRREAGLGALLPPVVGFPVSLETGVTGGFEWSLSREIQGENLGELWPGLDWDQRIDAMRQLWQKVEAVHTVSPAAAAPFVLKQSLFYPRDAAGAQIRLGRVFARGFIAAPQVVLAGAILDRFWQVYGQAPKVLNHGDFTAENALYHAGQVVSLLDFEYALVAPPEIDANELLKGAFLPPEAPDPLPDPGGEGLKRYRQAVIEMALPMLDHPGSADLLLGYAVMLGLWAIENELAHPDEKSPGYLARFQEELSALCDGHGGYLAPILARLG